MVTCILQEGNAYFLVTKVDDVITLKVPITAGVAGLFLALGVPRCS
ncbi:hypothetical protein bthur0014_19790 [Bacillus thuringiensis IBL 4222]|nr:exosporium protein ExsG [Bacillus cereus]EEN03321.1 hypothetical protein bthur0014_19790 [Bacillus thuringiensis IBL 4222]